MPLCRRGSALEEGSNVGSERGDPCDAKLWKAPAGAFCAHVEADLTVLCSKCCRAVDSFPRKSGFCRSHCEKGIGDAEHAIGGRFM